MAQRHLVTGAVIFAVGAGLGSLLTYVLLGSSRPVYPFAMSEDEWEVAEAEVDRLKASVILGGVAQACIWKRSDSERWTLPESEFDLIDQLVAEDLITRDIIDGWPGAERRPAGEPPFYIAGALEIPAEGEVGTMLFYEHPAHDPDGGGAIVYTDARTEVLDSAAFEAAIAALKP